MQFPTFSKNLWNGFQNKKFSVYEKPKQVKNLVTFWFP